MPESPVPLPTPSRLYRAAWALVAYTVVVILWGAWVRISGSGAGCGDHWPLCNGDAIPQASNVQTWIEYSHRISTGLYGIFVVALLLTVRRTFPKAHPARFLSGMILVFTVTEALIGRMLVKQGLVNQSIDLARIAVMPLHLVNTSLLLFFCVTTAESIGFQGQPQKSERVGRWQMSRGMLLCIVGILCIVTTGAVAALGSHLAPSTSLSQGIAVDLASDSHLAVRLRLLHPVLALSLALTFFYGCEYLAARSSSPVTARWLNRLKLCVVGAVGVGICTLLSLSPVLMKMLHLLLANAVVVVCSAWVFHMGRGEE
jgi:cytochrome c oxidase assembly protein subunit 15